MGKTTGRRPKSAARVSRPPKAPAQPGVPMPVPSVLRQKKAKKPAKKSSRPAAPMSDDELGAVDGVPDEARIDEVADSLTADRAVFKRLRTLLAEHFGSHAAARLWLSSPGMGFEPTPLEAVRRGEVRQVLEVLESQWGPNPTYA